MNHTTGYAVVKMEKFSIRSDAMEVARIREIASSVEGVREISLNEMSKVISFLNVDWDCRINVYYTTGTVATCLDHPFSGKTQLFRRKVDYALLKRIFEDPRVHTGEGYHHTGGAPSKEAVKIYPRLKLLEYRNEQVEDEETEIRRQLQILQPQVDLLRSQLQTLEAKRAAEKAAAEAQREKERLREEAARRKEAVEREEARQRAEEEQRRIADEQARVERAERVRRAQVAHQRHVNTLGNSCDYSLRCDNGFPQSMSHVTSVALSAGGYVVVYECGECNHHGISPALAAVLERQHCLYIQYIAAGPEGQYFIRKTNGKLLYHGPDEFIDALDNADSPVQLVAFGDFETFYIRFADGHSAWSDGLEELLGGNVIQLLANADVESVWLSSRRRVLYSMFYQVERIGYYIGYSNGCSTSAYLPDGVQEWLDQKNPTVKVKQVLADERENYFIRFS